jgi:ribonuclease-3
VLSFLKKQKPLLPEQKGFYSFLKEILPFPPRNLPLYQTAFITRSDTLYINDLPVNNERLEFLGDTVISTIVAEYLYNLFPEKDEGSLTKLRARIVNRNTLNEIALTLGMDKHVKYTLQSENQHRHIYGDVFEAFIGALFLDHGYRKTKKFFLKTLFRKYIPFQEILDNNTDFKSLMVEWAQKNRIRISFVTREQKEINGKHIFRTLLQTGNEILGTGSGRSKKEAEQDAAKVAYGRIHEI